MSLQIWLPLTKDLRQQGLDNSIITGTNVTINSNGKLGSCYSFNGNSSYLLSNSSPFSNNTDNWSYACWFKPNNQHQGCLFSCRTGTNSTGMTIFYYNTQILFDDGVRWQFTPSTAITIGTWNHLVFVRKKGVGKYCYLNGNLVGSTTTTGTQTTVGTNYAIGNSQSANTSLSGNPLNGYLNDVRIYDHALSQMEVKELSKGLVLHYLLNGDNSQTEIDSTIEYDCSGYCNNGSKITDTITYTSDTAKYTASTHFNGTYDGILIENLQLSDIINSAVTYAFWIKPESESGARSVYFGSYNTGPSWSIEKTTGNVMRSYWNGSPDETCSGATITDGVWQHVCLTKSGTNDIKVYINGVQKWASTATHSNLNFPTTFRIGRDTRSNDGTPYKGLMSDFRIYATALSADDVKSLYQNSAYIDSSGNVYGAVHTEV